METKRFRLASMPGAQAHVAITIDRNQILSITLVSYVTEVIKIDLACDTPYWTCSGTYSKTTARHIGRFTQEFFNGNYYYACKGLEQTGEAVLLEEDQMAYAKHQAMRYLYDGIANRYWGKY